MKRSLARAVVDCLRLSDQPHDFDRLRKFSLRQWRQAAGWLDHSGLTLYFLDRLQANGAAAVLPQELLSRFEQSLADNRLRVDDLARESGRINDTFNQAGVEYAVIKGLSLWPDFCPDPYLRAQVDLDYLIGPGSIEPAHSAIQQLGYEPKVCFERSLPVRAPSAKTPLPFGQSIQGSNHAHGGVAFSDLG